MFTVPWLAVHVCTPSCPWHGTTRQIRRHFFFSLDFWLCHTSQGYSPTISLPNLNWNSSRPGKLGITSQFSFRSIRIQQIIYLFFENLSFLTKHVQNHLSQMRQKNPLKRQYIFTSINETRIKNSEDSSLKSWTLLNIVLITWGIIPPALSSPL